MSLGRQPEVEAARTTCGIEHVFTVLPPPAYAGGSSLRCEILLPGHTAGLRRWLVELRLNGIIVRNAIVICNE